MYMCKDASLSFFADTLNGIFTSLLLHFWLLNQVRYKTGVSSLPVNTTIMQIMTK